MGTVRAGVGVKSATISAKVIRADGTVENLGVIARTPAKMSMLRRAVDFAFGGFLKFPRGG